VRAQQSVRPVIGFLSSRSPDEAASFVAAFRKGLAEAGFTEGRNVVTVFLPELAAELVREKVALIVAVGGTPSALAAKAATDKVPIVFIASDPVAAGIVTSLSRPGGNVTGIGLLATDLIVKSIELLKEMLPSARHFVFLANPANPRHSIRVAEAHSAATAVGAKLDVVNATSERELDEAFKTAAGTGAQGILLAGEAFFDSRRSEIVALAARHKLPACYGWRDYVAAGGLMSYGSNLVDAYRQGGAYAARVLSGALPADLPVVQPKDFELVINLRTARALGITVPPALLARADEVIE
jgi:putative tryptophan/tyrosine transport system substrate-binding protein